MTGTKNVEYVLLAVGRGWNRAMLDAKRVKIK